MPFTCPRCGRTSHNPNDHREGYCGACHWWTGDAALGHQLRLQDRAEGMVWHDELIGALEAKRDD